jgi:hypothetical protein
VVLTPLRRESGSGSELAFYCTRSASSYGPERWSGTNRFDVFASPPGVWVLLAVMAVLNGGLREAVLIQLVGQYGVDVLSTELLVGAILLVSFVYSDRTAIDYSRAELQPVSALWTARTVGFGVPRRLRRRDAGCPNTRPVRRASRTGLDRRSDHAVPRADGLRPVPFQLTVRSRNTGRGPRLHARKRAFQRLYREYRRCDEIPRPSHARSAGHARSARIVPAETHAGRTRPFSPPGIPLLSGPTPEIRPVN